MGALSDITARLLGRSTYQPPEPNGVGPSESDQESLRRAMGGQMQLPTWTQSRWYLADLETAEHNADSGDLRMAGRLMAAARRDGVMTGVLSTRTGGLVRLPKHFRGDEAVVQSLDVGRDSVRSVFDEMLPPDELALMAADGVLLGVAVGELIPVRGRAYPVLCRLDPQYLQYVWSENRWYYLSALGRLPITPGNGKWVLHTPGGRIAPWNNALWRAIGRAYIRKDHANWHKDAWEAKLAHPARVAVAPQGAQESQREAWFKQVMAWGINSVFGMTPGYDVKLVESNGRGFDCFVKTIADQNTEMIISIAGQTVTTNGGDAAFQNSDIHKTIRADLIKSTADSLAYTINTQCIPVYVAGRYGADAINSMPCIMEWDVTPPKDRNAEAQSMVTVANAISTLTTSLAGSEQKLDVPKMCEQFAIPTLKLAPAGDAKSGLRLVGGTDVDGAGDAAALASPDKAVQDTALNGAQGATMLQIVTAVAAGQVPRDAGIGMLKRTFLVDDATAAEMMGSAGAGFTPAAAEPAPPAAPTEAAA